MTAISPSTPEGLRPRQADQQSHPLPPPTPPPTPPPNPPARPPAANSDNTKTAIPLGSKGQTSVPAPSPIVTDAPTPADSGTNPKATLARRLTDGVKNSAKKIEEGINDGSVEKAVTRFIDAGKKAAEVANRPDVKKAWGQVVKFAMKKSKPSSV